MPRPTTSTTDSLESPPDLQSSRLTSTNSVPLSLTNSNATDRALMEEKSIQCLSDHENSTTDEQKTKKRNGQMNDDSWTVAADTYEFLLCSLIPSSFLLFF